MKLHYSIDALTSSGRKAWRLQKDLQHWRACIYAETTQISDATFTDQDQAQAWTMLRMQKHHDFILIPKQKAGTFDFLMRGIFTHAVLHRESSAPIPEQQQMLQLITSLEPGTAWLVYLNVAGHFKALRANHEKIIGNLDIAVRGEIASSANYIGAHAACDEALMNSTYHQFLGGWWEHLRTSNMGIFIPDVEKLQEQQEYLAFIRSWQPETENTL